MHFVGTADRGGTGFGEAKRFHLALLDEVGHGSDRIFDRHVRVDAVLVEKVDLFDAEPSKR